jgi:hypothetical protein
MLLESAIVEATDHIAEFKAKRAYPARATTPRQ